VYINIWNKIVEHIRELDQQEMI